MVSLSLSTRPWRDRRWLILAPHPDDETLGAAGLIAQAANAGCLAGVVYLTDGSASHPMADGTARLVAARKREAALALHRLTGTRTFRPVHLGWRDAAPARVGDRMFDRSVRRIAALCRRWHVDVLAVTASHEPHCDHAAAAALARATQERAIRAIRVAEYLVWADRPAAHHRNSIRTALIRPGLRRQALAAHRSQLTASHGPGFRLPATRLRMPTYDMLYVRRDR